MPPVVNENAAFDEISIGSGWQNEHIVRLIRQEHIAEAALPLVILVSRTLSATLEPLNLVYGPDSVVKVVQGSRAIVEWVRDGASLMTVVHAGIATDRGTASDDPDAHVASPLPQARRPPAK